ncbi:MAG TPA: hypothetical protein VF730_08375 [Terracidiphilus sp.]
MHTDPMEMWRELSRNYAQMSEGELVNLAEDYSDLTEMARQALGDEMRKRGLGEPQDYTRDQRGALSAAQRGAALRTAAGAEDEGEPSTEFVWKNVLCECSSREEAWQIGEVLRRAGIESWVDRRQMIAPLPDAGSGGQRVSVLVASDTLDEARSLTAQPIPLDIVELSKAENQEYVPPVCPGCGAEDPVLESADPVNAWKCEVCGRQWTDALPETE